MEKFQQESIIENDICLVITLEVVTLESQGKVLLFKNKNA